jgi:hypothetical protein
VLEPLEQTAAGDDPSEWIGTLPARDRDPAADWSQRVVARHDIPGNDFPHGSAGHVGRLPPT